MSLSGQWESKTSVRKSRTYRRAITENLGILIFWKFQDKNKKLLKNTITLYSFWTLAFDQSSKRGFHGRPRADAKNEDSDPSTASLSNVMGWNKWLMISEYVAQMLNVHRVSRSFAEIQWNSFETISWNLAEVMLKLLYFRDRPNTSNLSKTIRSKFAVYCKHSCSVLANSARSMSFQIVVFHSDVLQLCCNR